jgi:hypothetical protein
MPLTWFLLVLVSVKNSSTSECLYIAYPSEYKPSSLRHQNEHFFKFILSSVLQLRNNTMHFRILYAPRKGGYLTQGRFWGFGQVSTSCSYKDQSKPCAAGKKGQTYCPPCNWKLSRAKLFALPNHYEAYTSLCKNILGSPKATSYILPPTKKKKKKKAE